MSANGKWTSREDRDRVGRTYLGDGVDVEGEGVDNELGELDVLRERDREEVRWDTGSEEDDHFGDVPRGFP